MSKKYDIETIIKDGDKIWYTPMQISGFCYYDTKTGENNYYPECELGNLYRRYNSCFKLNDAIYFIPGNSEKILKITANQNEINYDYIDVEKGRYRTSFVHNNDVYLFKYENEKKLIKVNLLNGVISEVLSNDIIGDIAPQVSMNNNLAYMAFYDKNKVLVYNCDTNSYEWINVDESETGFANICFDGECLWLSGKQYIYCINKEKNVIKIEYDFEEISLFEKFKEKQIRHKKSLLDEYPFWNITCSANEVIFLPRCGSKIISVNKTTFIPSTIEMKNEEETEETLNRLDRSTLTHYFATSQEDEIYVYSMVSQYLYIFDKKQFSLKNKIVLKRNRIVEIIGESNEIIRENNENTLEEYLECINEYI